MAAINKAYVYVDSMRNMWVDYNAVINQSFFTILFNLVTIFTMFYELFIHMDSIFKNSLVMNLPVTVVLKLSDINNIEKVKNNFFSKMTTITLLTASIPGASCRSIAYRAGTYFRFLFDVSYD